MKLPTQPKPVETVFDKYSILLWGRPKIGKTTLFSTFPDCIFIATEPGLKGLSVNTLPPDEPYYIRDWAEFLEAVEVLEANPGQFPAVAIDTADKAYEMCLNHVCASRGWQYPGVEKSGRVFNDRGAGWNAIKREFAQTIDRIAKTGRAVHFTSHYKIDQEDQGRLVPSMGGQARAVTGALADIFLYADYMRDKSGKVRRVLITEGTDKIWSGKRETPGKFPFFLPLPEDPAEDYAVLKAAFDGKLETDQSEFTMDSQTSAQLKTALAMEKLRKSATTAGAK